MEEGHLKLGFPNPRGWMSYWWDGLLFVKRAAFDVLATYYDFGSSSECYCHHEFIELETLSPKSEIQAGDSINHKETWEIFSDIEWPENIQDLVALIES